MISDEFEASSISYLKKEHHTKGQLSKEKTKASGATVIHGRQLFLLYKWMGGVSDVRIGVFSMI
jgi:hypothetical protein